MLPTPAAGSIRNTWQKSSMNFQRYLLPCQPLKGRSLDSSSQEILSAGIREKSGLRVQSVPVPAFTSRCPSQVLTTARSSQHETSSCVTAPVSSIRLVAANEYI